MPPPPTLSSDKVIEDKTFSDSIPWKIADGDNGIQFEAISAAELLRYIDEINEVYANKEPNVSEDL